MTELDQGKDVFSTYTITYKGKEGKEAIYVDLSRLAMWFNEEKASFPLHSAFLAMDEGMAGMDSRTSSSYANRFLSLFISQSRHLGLDVAWTVQWGHEVDKRIRGIADVGVYAVAEPTGEVYPNGDEICDFHYWQADGRTGDESEFYIYHEDAPKVWQWYNTQQLVLPPEASVSDKARKDFKARVKKAQTAERESEEDERELLRKALGIATS